MSAELAHPEMTPQRLDCLAGAGGFELANVVAGYPFEMSCRFPATKQKLASETFGGQAANSSHGTCQLQS
jgi:hypothetical protein